MATYIEASPIGPSGGHAGDRPVMTRAGNFLLAVAAWRRRMHENSVKRRNLRLMRDLNNHVLRDIGLDRSELASVVYNSRRERRRCYDPR
jgi:hypothetical protein